MAAERQLEVTGPDAAQFMAPRGLSNMAVGQCKYILMTNADGGVLNALTLLKLTMNGYPADCFTYWLVK